MSEERQDGNNAGTQPGENDPISIKVVASTGEEVYFKIKRNTKLKKLQGAYAAKVGKDANNFRFLYDGNRIQDDDTPATLDMENDDTIDVMVEQVGGGPVNSASARCPFCHAMAG